MKNLAIKSVFCIGFLTFLSGCVVYERPRPYCAYEDWDGPTVVYYHDVYYGGCGYHRRWR